MVLMSVMLYAKNAIRHFIKVMNYVQNVKKTTMMPLGIKSAIFATRAETMDYNTYTSQLAAVGLFTSN